MHNINQFEVASRVATILSNQLKENPEFLNICDSYSITLSPVHAVTLVKTPFLSLLPEKPIASVALAYVIGFDTFKKDVSDALLPVDIFIDQFAIKILNALLEQVDKSQKDDSESVDLSKTQSDNSILNEPRDAFSLWNPNAAANWSLIFTPAFGSYIQMLNWQSLNNPEKASKARIWFYISLGMLVFYILAALFIQDSQKVDTVTRGVALLFIFIWYFSVGREQGKYIKESFGKNYNKKSWVRPLLLAWGLSIIAVVLTFGIDYLFNALNSNSENKDNAYYEQAQDSASLASAAATDAAAAATDAAQSAADAAESTRYENYPDENIISSTSTDITIPDPALSIKADWIHVINFDDDSKYYIDKASILNISPSTTVTFESSVVYPDGVELNYYSMYDCNNTTLVNFRESQFDKDGKLLNKKFFKEGDSQREVKLTGDYFLHKALCFEIGSLTT